MIKKLLKEFKEFTIKGNIIEMSVAVLIGTSFKNIVTAFVEGVVMPFLGILLNKVELSDWKIDLPWASLQYGLVVQSVIDFFIIALSIFVAFKVYQRIKKKLKTKK